MIFRSLPSARLSDRPPALDLLDKVLPVDARRPLTTKPGRLIDRPGVEVVVVRDLPAHRHLQLGHGCSLGREPKSVNASLQSGITREQPVKAASRAAVARQRQP